MEADIFVNHRVRIRGHELEVSTSRSGGPGGQNVQKTDSRVTLRWNIARSTSVDEETRSLLLLSLAHRLTTEGEILVNVDTERSQMRNRQIARERLAETILRALHRDKPRRKTKPSAKSKARRLDEKKRAGTLKQRRSAPIAFD